MKVVKMVIDPGIEGDTYADKPYLFGPALSSVNVLSVGEKNVTLEEEEEEQDGEGNGEMVLEEGGRGDGVEVRKEKGVPVEAGARKKWFLDEKHRKEWVFEKGRVYSTDFFNPFLDFNKFALKLPGGLSFKLMSYWDGQPLR